MEITLGCDPELFVSAKGQPRCAWGLIPGTKEEPFPVPNGAVQVDGFALEFNINPAKTEEEFVGNITSVMNTLRIMVPDKYDFMIVPSVRFNAAHFKAQPDEAKILGCTPDFNAYTLDANPIPDNETTFRTSGGHIHIGFMDKPEEDPHSIEHMVRCSVLIKQLDFYLGLSSLMFDQDYERRSMYGQAGCFRPKSYGVEYRSLSNAWIKDSKRMKFVYSTVHKAIEDLRNGIRPWQGKEEKVRQFINTSDSHRAQYYLETAGLVRLARDASKLR